MPCVCLLEIIICLIPSNDNDCYGDVADVLMYNTDGRCSMYAQADAILEYFNLFHFFQCNVIRNIFGQTLDLIFSSANIITEEASDPLLSVDAYHPPLILCLSSVSTAACSKRDRWNFRSANYLAINDFLGGIDWDVSVGGLGVDEAVDF